MMATARRDRADTVAMSISKESRKEVVEMFPEAIRHMKDCLGRAGNNATDDEIITAWSEYSDSLCAGWLGLPDADDELLAILLRHLPERKNSTNRYVVTLIPVDDDSNDAWLPLPDELLDDLGWKSEDTLEITRNTNQIVLTKKTLIP